jgi:hypothetical protein
VLAVAEALELTLGADTVHGLQTMYVVILLGRRWRLEHYFGRMARGWGYLGLR